MFVTEVDDWYSTKPRSYGKFNSSRKTVKIMEAIFENLEDESEEEKIDMESQAVSNSTCIEDPPTVNDATHNNPIPFSGPTYADVVKGIYLIPNALQRNIFLSRLTPETTAELVKMHIDYMFNTTVPVVVEKMNTRRNAEYSSFIILTGTDETLYEYLIHSSFWPRGILVKQFVEKEKVWAAKSIYDNYLSFQYVPGQYY